MIAVPERPRLPVKLQESIKNASIRSTSEPRNINAPLKGQLRNFESSSALPRPLSPPTPPVPPRRRSLSTDQSSHKLTHSTPTVLPPTTQVRTTPVPRPGLTHSVPKVNSSPAIKRQSRQIFCPGCNKAIQWGPKTITIQCLRRSWHPKCLTCHKCHLPFDQFFENFTPLNGRPFHTSCLNK